MNQDIMFDDQQLSSSELGTADLDAFLANPPVGLTQSVSLPMMWADWEFDDNDRLALAHSSISEGAAGASSVSWG